MLSRYVGALATLALVLVCATPAEAQGRLHLGPRVSYQFDLEELALGGQFGAPVARNLEFYPSFDYYLVESGTVWNLNADLKYRVPAQSIEWLYVGGGLNILHSAVGDVSISDAGFNLLAGAESRRGRVHPFVEFRITSNNGSTAQLSAGLNFTLRE